MRIKDLSGGDIIANHSNGYENAYSTFIGASKHPVHENLALVVWKLQDGTYSFDALSWEQDVGFLSSFRNHNLETLEMALK